jgi:hypothetical protein
LVLGEARRHVEGLHRLPGGSAHQLSMAENATILLSLESTSKPTSTMFVPNTYFIFG